MTCRGWWVLGAGRRRVVRTRRWRLRDPLRHRSAKPVRCHLPRWERGRSNSETRRTHTDFVWLMPVRSRKGRSLRSRLVKNAKKVIDTKAVLRAIQRSPFPQPLPSGEGLRSNRVRVRLRPLRRTHPQPSIPSGRGLQKRPAFGRTIGVRCVACVRSAGSCLRGRMCLCRRGVWGWSSMRAGCGGGCRGDSGHFLVCGGRGNFGRG